MTDGVPPPPSRSRRPAMLATLALGIAAGAAVGLASAQTRTSEQGSLSLPSSPAPLLLPEVLAAIVAIAIVFGHTAGGFTWLHIIPERHWFQTLHGLLFISATVLGLGLHWSLRKARLDETAGPRLSPLIR